MPITRLPDQVITRIAAGQVIERPAYVVKELIENAVDAEADAVQIQVEKAGLVRISVRDNGTGMNKTDLREAYKHYTTSKIHKETNLTGIRTMGFRGEALASIAAMSDLIIQSKDQESVSGYKIVLQNGQIEEFSSVGMAQGTLVDVHSLFSRVPARMKYVRTSQTEFRHILDIVLSYALAFPHCAFTLIHNGKEIFSVPQGQKEEERVRTVMGSSFSSQLLPLISPGENENPYLHLHGYISRPQLSYTTPKQFFFVNGRPVQSTAISNRIKKAYGSLLEPRQFPVVVLYLSIPYEMVDVNIDPRKEQVRFHAHTDVIEEVSRSVSGSLKRQNLTYSGFVPGHESFREKPTKSYAASILKKEVAPWSVRAPAGDVKSVFQIHNTFLVLETETGITIIDQHAAHERILYEQFLQAFQGKKMTDTIYPLSEPVVLSLSASDSARIRQYYTALADLGFRLQERGKDVWQIETVPSLFRDRSLEPLFLEVLEDLESEEFSPKLDRQTQKLLSYLACRGAIKAGDSLTAEEMKRLLDKLSRTRTRYTCPHGRPVQRDISLQELYRLFKRT